MTVLKLLLAPINPRLGALAGNLAMLREARAEGARQGVDLVATPAASLSGMPEADLGVRPEILSACEAALATLASETADGGPGLLVGTPWKESGRLHAGMVLLEGGQVLARRVRHEVSGGADERLRAGPAPGPVAFRGARLGLMSGADVTEASIAETLLETGADLLLSLTATPFGGEAEDRASDIALARAVETGLPILGLNLLGGQGGWLYPGGGYVLNADYTLAARLPSFDPSPMLATWERRPGGWQCLSGANRPTVDDGPPRLWQALCLGLADAASKGGFSGIMVDEAEGPVAALLAQAARKGGARVTPSGLPAEPPSLERDAAMMRRASAEQALLLCAADATALALGEGGRAGHLTPLHDLWRSDVAALAIALGLEPPSVDQRTEALLRGLLVEENAVDALAMEGYDPAIAVRLWRTVAAAAYKRRQAPAALRLGRNRADPFANGMTSDLP